MSLAQTNIRNAASAARAFRRVDVTMVPRAVTFGVRGNVRAQIARAGAMRSTTLQRVAVDVPAGVRLDRILEQ
jgi:hypothetical protein